MVHHVAVGIPVSARPGIDQLYEPHTTLDEAPCCETLPGEPFRASPLQSIELVSRIALYREVKGFRRSHLHAKGGLETLDAGLREGVTAAAGKMLTVQTTQCGKLQFLARHSNPRLYVGNGLGPRHHQRSLVCTGKKVTRINLRARIGLPGRDGNEGRQVLIKRPQPVADPRPDAGPCESKGAGMHSKGGVVVVRMIGMHRPDQGNIIDAGSHLGKERAHFRSTLPVWRKLPLGRLEENTLIPGTVLDLGVFCLHLLAYIRLEPWLGIEGIHMRNPTRHEEKDHPLGLGRIMPLPRG